MPAGNGTPRPGGETLRHGEAHDRPPAAIPSIIRDVAIGIVMFVAAVGLASATDLNEIWMDFAEEHEDYEIDELPMGLSIFFAGAIWMIVRRLKQLQVVSRWLASEIVRRKKAEADAVAANQAKSDFLAMMSHELRTPLNAVNGFSEVMRHELYGPIGHAKYKEYADDIHRSGNRLLAIINTILDLSKIEAGKMELRQSEIWLSDLVEDAIRELSMQASVEGIRFERAEGTSNTVVIGDRGLILQAAANLLSNAVKFTEAGGVITTGIHCDDDGKVRISVSDTGIGMAPDQIPIALQEFGQIESGMTRKYAGTGLGLPLTRRIMLEHGGDLEIASRPGEGTTATLVFPKRRVITSEQVLTELQAADSGSGLPDTSRTAA